MLPRERFLAALLGGKPDRTPLACVAALAPVELQERTGCLFPEAHLDPEKLVRLSAANHEVLGFDGVSFIVNYFNEPAALGARIDWGNPTSLPMFASHPWRRPEDAAAPGDLLERDPIRSNLRALRIAKERYGGRVGIVGKVMGPLSMVQAMHGVEETMLLFYDDPPKLLAFLDAAVGILARSANAQFEAGIDAVLIGEGGAGAQMLSPAMYERYLFGAHRELVAAIRGPTILHVCGDVTPRLAALAEVGFDCFNFDWAISPSVMKRAAAGRFSVMGNVRTSDLLRGSPEEIERQVRECLEAGVDVISPGCAVSPECPLENFLAMGRAIASWTEARGGAPA
ncbi:MAG: uroporphyrinogen decarboxylase family protein [Planctomycetota bacterium]